MCDGKPRDGFKRVKGPHERLKMTHKITMGLYLFMMTLVIVVLCHGAYVVLFVEDTPASQMTAKEFCKGINK